MTGRKCLSPDLKWRRWGDVDKGILVLLQRGWRIKYQLKANAILVTRRKITAAIFLLSVNREVTDSSGGLYILHGVWERPPANNLKYGDQAQAGHQRKGCNNPVVEFKIKIQIHKDLNVFQPNLKLTRGPQLSLPALSPSCAQQGTVWRDVGSRTPIRGG